METQEYNKTYNIPFYFSDLLKLIKSLPIKDKLKIEKELEEETLLYRSKQLSKKIKSNSLDMENIVAEISEYRAGQK
jgi:tRNA G26 N,N-dimethylase Trm1